MHPYLNIAISAARAAGKIIINAMLHPNSVTVNQKTSIQDVVTNVDRACEDIIIKTITKAYPEHNIEAEESGLINNNSNITWIIDPLDGTLNFVHQFPFFAVSIGIIENNIIQHGVVYNPIADELFTATKGSGAKLNNKRIRCSEITKLKQAFLALDTNLLLQIPDNTHLLPSRGLSRDLGSAALHLAFVASGRLDGYCDFHLKPWDIAAGALLVKEAGGFITDFNNKPDFLTNGDVIAANPKIHAQLLDAI